MINLLNISLFTACKNKKIFDFILKPNIMRDAVRVKIINNNKKFNKIIYNTILLNIMLFNNYQSILTLTAF